MSFTFSTFISSISAGINLMNLTKDRKKRTVEALTALQFAVIKTREHLEKAGYQPNTELSKLWLLAFEKVQNANLFNDYYQIEELYHKAKFWGNPQLWLREKTSMELIPKLKDLEIHCDTLITQMNE